jgi:hypothetical protein
VLAARPAEPGAVPGWLTRLRRSQILVFAALAVVAGLALATGIDVEWPRWVHNLSDLVQIATALLALLAWDGARRARH